MSRASYARARRNATPQEAKLRPALEKVAKKVYTTAKPTVDRVKSGAVTVVKGYLKGTQAIADKLKPALMKLPKGKGTPRHRIRKRM
jgi:hypothetical protein